MFIYNKNIENQFYSLLLSSCNYREHQNLLENSVVWSILVVLVWLQVHLFVLWVVMVISEVGGLQDCCCHMFGLNNHIQGLRKRSSALHRPGVLKGCGQGRPGDWLVSEISKKLFYQMHGTDSPLQKTESPREMERQGGGKHSSSWGLNWTVWRSEISQ